MKKCVFAVFIFTCFLLIFSALFNKTGVYSLPFLKEKQFLAKGAFSFDALLKSKELLLENERLRSEIIKYRSESVNAQQLAEENASLKDELGINKKTDKKTDVYASVIALSTEEGFFLTIDKGKSDGIMPQDAVVFSKAAVGKVVKVFENAAIVAPITAPNQTTGAKNKIGSTGLVTGDAALFLKNQCSFSFFEESLKILPGDEIFTSHHSEIFPEGYLIGSVESVNEKITVNCEIDFFKLKTLCVKVAR